MPNPIACVDLKGNQLAEPLTLICSSPEAKRVISFYKQLGLAMGPIQAEKTGQQFVIGRCRGFTAKFIAGQKASRETKSPLCFMVDDVAALMQRVMSAGGRIVSPLQDDDGDWRKAVVADPEGRKLTLLQRIPASPRTFEAVSPIEPQAAAVTDAANSGGSSLSEGASSECAPDSSIAEMVAETLKHLGWGMRAILVACALSFFTASICYFVVERTSYYEGETSVHSLLNIVSALSAVLLTTGAIQVWRSSNGAGRQVLIAAAATIAISELLHAYGRYFRPHPDQNLITYASYVRLAGILLLGGWYFKAVGSADYPQRGIAKYWFLPVLLVVATSQDCIVTRTGDALMAYFFAVLPMLGVAAVFVLFFGWTAVCNRFGDRVPTFLQPVTSRNVTRSLQQLAPDQLQALKTGTTMIMAALGAMIILVAVGFAFAESGRSSRSGAPTSAIVLICLGAVASAVQIYGKLVIMPIGTQGERILMLFAVGIESVGVLLRCAAVFNTDPYLSARMINLAFLCHANELFLALFLWNVTARIGTPTALNLARVLVLCTVIPVAAVANSFFQSSSRDAMEFAVVTLLICGIVGFICLVGILISLRRLSAVEPSDQGRR